MLLPVERGIIVTFEDVNIWYSNLSTCNIKRGDKILRGAIIGTMPKSGYENANAYLDLIIKKGEYYYSAKYFWKK